MIDASHPAASWYLWITTLVFVVVFALPLFLAPLRWAQWFRWRVGDDTDLATYFGRCLGGVALALAIGWIRAALHPAQHPVVLEITIGGGALMTVVHIRGALERRQPWTETAEIAMYAAFTLVAVWIYRGL